MGHRANLVLVKNREYDLYYTHWGAKSLPRDLFWGQKHAVRFIQAQQLVEHTAWLDDVWAEGGALVDLDERVLMVFGGEDVTYDVAQRHVYLSALGCVWKDWQIRWAFEGVGDMVDYVGYPRTKVLSPGTSEESPDCSLAPPEDPDWTSVIGSIRFVDDRLRIYPLGEDIETYLAAGVELLAAPEIDRGLEALALPDSVDWYPVGGFHIDIPSHTIEFWNTDVIVNPVARVADHWPGWNVQWHKDSYAFQSERTGGLVKYSPASQQVLIERISEWLLAEPGRSGAELVAEMAERERREGKNVEINPNALRDDRVELSPEVRRRILASAIANLHNCDVPTEGS